MSSCVFTISKVGGFPASLRSLLQHFTISWWFVLPPHICSNFPLLQLMTVALSPSLVSLWVGLGSVFSVMTSTLFGNRKQVSFPYLCLFLAEEAQLPSHAQCSSPLSISMVFCWLPSSFPMSFFHWVAQKWKPFTCVLPLTCVCTAVLSFILAREHMILRAWSPAVELSDPQQFSVVGRTESKERQTWRREKATGYLNTSLSFMVLGLTSWERSPKCLNEILGLCCPFASFWLRYASSLE